MVGYYYAGQTLSVEKMRHMVQMSFLSLPSLIVFLTVFYLSLGRVSLNAALCFSFCSWVLCASLLIIIFGRMH